MNSKLISHYVIFGVGLLVIIGTLAFTYKRRKKQTWAKWVFRAVATLAAVFILIFVGFKRPDPFFNANVVPKLITANIVDVKDVYMVSKFRSGAGHDYSGNGETCRSMKHYINVSHGVTGPGQQATRSQPTPDHPNIIVHAPYDGLIVNASHEDGKLGYQVDIMPWHNPFYTVRLDHVGVATGIHMLSVVSSGQAIGSIGPKDGMDISYWAGDFDLGGSYGQLVSYFQGMTDQTFAPWAALGYKRDDFVITKAYRDAHPLQCTNDPNSDAFVETTPHDSAYQKANYVMLRPDPYGNVFDQPATSQPSFQAPSPTAQPHSQ